MRSSTGIHKGDLLDVIHAQKDEKEKQRLFDIIDAIEGKAVQ
jgi:hypothetical protein